MTAPFPLRRVIDCAKRLMARQGFDRRRAIKAALEIVARTPQAPVEKRRPMPAETQEHLTHRARSMRAWGRP